MKKNRYFLGVAILVVVLIISCGKTPQTEVDAVKAALDTLIAQGADKILAEDFEDLQNELDDALGMVQKQSSKMFKSFGEAKEKLSDVVVDANDLLEKMDKKREELMKEVRKFMAEIGTINTDNKNMLPKTGSISSQQLILRNEAYVVDTAIEEVKAMLNDDDIIKALDKLKELKAEAERINAELKKDKNK